MDAVAVMDTVNLGAMVVSSTICFQNDLDLNRKYTSYYTIHGETTYQLEEFDTREQTYYR